MSDSAAGKDQQYLQPLLQGRARVLVLLAVVAWAAALLFFWTWWLRPEHNVAPGRFWFNSVVIAWLTLVPIYFVAIFVRARIPTGGLELPAGTRVAMVVTKTPQEPFDVVVRTLKAMLSQQPAHDTWLADEDPREETLAWCAANGVHVSTRKGVADYHRATWPRRTRCKEGNLAYFYDHYGYDRYDIVIQMDADHVPAAGYLAEMLKPFVDPRVGYVSAPSICDSNAATSWSARGRLFTEATVHGLLQAGYSAGWAPLCIGSHYAVRTRALREIGGLGPELAEDHSTSLMMNAHGWRGVHAFNAIANGEGPCTFPDMITQEFQWSRSLVTILLQHSPKLLRSLPWHLRFQFLFCQLWYPLFGFFMLALFMLPILALAGGQALAAASIADYYLHIIWVELLLVLLALKLRSYGWLRPADAKIFCTDHVLYFAARWPWMLAGSFMAVADFVSRRFVDYRITPKGNARDGALPVRAVAPYLALSAISGLAVVAIEDPGDAAGFYLFATINAVLYAVLVGVIVIRHRAENGIPWEWGLPSAPVRAAAFGLLLGAGAIAALVARGPQTFSAVAYNTPLRDWTSVEFTVAGAGQRTKAMTRFTFGSEALAR